MFSHLKADIRRTYDLAEGSHLRRTVECFRSPGVQAVAVFRFGHWLIDQPWMVRLLLSPVYVLLHHHVRVSWGIFIQRQARIGPGLYIGHWGGIFVHDDAIAGSSLTLSQNVTIGISGECEHRGCPHLGDNVHIAPGAILVGKIKIGNNVHIGPNAVVLKDIPDSAVVAAPASRVVMF